MPPVADAATGVAPAAAAPARLTVLAAALAAGIAAAAWSPGPLVAPWAAIGIAALVAAAVVAARRRRGALALLAVASAGLGGLWFTVRMHYVRGDELAARVGPAPAIVTVRGVALEGPELIVRTSGSLARFGGRPPAVRFALRVEAILPRRGPPVPARGRVLVRVGETVAPFAAGARLRTTGILYPPSAPRNPGEFDYRRAARMTGRAGLLDVPRRELVDLLRPPRAGPLRAWLRVREALRRRADGWLLADLPPPQRPRRDALLAALLLGRRGPQLDALGEVFRSTGLAHFLAISGLHVGILAGFVLLAARLAGLPRRGHGWLVIATVLAYLVIVELRMPVLRAGVMTVAACLGLAAGRHYHVGGLVAGSAAALLLWRPDQLFAAGFQLSYGVVLALVHLAPRLRARWFGRPDLMADSSARMLGQWLRTALTAAVTAWLTAAPIALAHWGVLWPLAAPFSVVVLPLVAVVLAAGYLKLALAALLPSAALVLAVPLGLVADVLISVVFALQAVPLASVAPGPAPPVWALAALGWVWAWGLLGGRVFGFWGGRRGRALLWAAGAALPAWLLAPALLPGFRPALRVDMLSVGDGSCYVIRSGSSTVVFDAGSAGDLDVGRRLIVPALRRLGVRSIDALVISHPNLDHYAAGLELVDAFDAQRVLVTPQFARAAAGDPSGPVMFFLDALAQRLVPLREAAAGAERRFGEASWTWLHPEAAASYADANDASMVILIEAAGRHVLLCGDVQQAAMGAMRGETPRVDVLELPHHGSFHDAAVRFAAAARPEVILQSTGPTRLRRTEKRWAAALPDVARLITARDGACWVEIDGDGRLTCGRFAASSG